MKIAITGGTGLIGSYLIPKLLERDHEILVISRGGKSIENVEILKADPSLTGDWQDQLKDVHAMVNLAGENIFAKRWTSKQKEKLIDSRVNTTKNLVSALNSSGTANPVMISISGADYYPSNKGEKTYTESDHPGTSFLSELCINWEEPVNSLEDKVRSVIFRLGVVFSHTNKGAEKMFLPHKMHFGGIIGSGKQIYSWIHIDDIVSLIVDAVENEKFKGTYNAVSPDPLSLGELTRIGGNILGRRTWTWVPGIMLKIVLGERADMLLKGKAISSKKLEDLGYEFKFSTAESALLDIFEKSEHYKVSSKYQG